MELANKDILIMGLGLTGISNIKTINKLNGNIILYDEKKEEDLVEGLKQISDISMKKYLGGKEVNLDNIDLVVKNPGIPFDNKIILEAKKRDIDVVTDLELAYRLNLTENLIVITGTNGKTTTTALVGEIFKNANKKTHVVGNIGLGIMWELYNGEKDDIAVVEASSFQLDGTDKLKPKVGAILNITEDHINWHKTYENYFKAKQKVFVNQDSDDFIVLNYDDGKLRDLKDNINSNIIWFSRKEKLENGIYLIDNYIFSNLDGIEKKIIDINDLKILGNHNIENAMASIAIALAMKIDIDIIVNTLREFKAVEHRIEYVTEINGVKYYNDSKGTNTDASIKAIEAINENIILIAGGADKKSSYDDFIISFKNRVKELILLGETKYDIEKIAKIHGFNNITIVDTMKEAVSKANKLAIEGDNVLLSPACASLDMYPNFETRGKDFKENILKLKE